jgi:hypothetical protein
MKKVIAMSFSLLISSVAMATHNGFTKVQIPISGINNSSYCLIKTLAVDGITSLESSKLLAARALNSPFRVAGFQSGEDKNGLLQINVLHNSGIKVEIIADGDELRNNMIIIDASKATKSAKTLEQRSRVIHLVKLALYSGVKNTLDSQLKTAFVQLKGLPDQRGVESPVPLKFNSAFSANSPFLRNLKTELDILDANEECQ